MRNEILNGTLPFPSINVVEANLGKDVATFATDFFKALWFNYLLNKGSISGAYWHDRCGNPVTFNVLLVSLSKSNWIISKAIPERNWLEIQLNEDKLLEFVSVDELENTRKQFKFAKYKLRDQEAYADTLVKSNGKVNQTGLIRQGFKEAANTSFYFDRQMMIKYKDPILANMVKGMTKMREKYPEIGSDSASYDAISEDILNWLTTTRESFTRGTTFMDSRGRAISSSLGKIANPIGYKDFRSLLVIPEVYRKAATQSGVDSILLFIAELNGYKKGVSKQDKMDYGLLCWLNDTKHDLSMDDEEDRKELYENIWLERLYKELDYAYNVDQTTKQLALLNGSFNGTLDESYKWSVPIELDASASMLQYTAMLLNDRKLAEMTNMIEGELTDPWDIPGISRSMVKKAATPMLYGSTKAAPELWKQNDMDFTLEDVKTYNEALAKGGLGLAGKFKDFILNNCKPHPIMKVHVWNDQFDIECNRYRQVGEKTSLYRVYDTESKSVKSVFHTSTKSIPDLEQFRRYFQTLLIHNLDSQVADEICYIISKNGGFVIDIHDAFLVSPEDAQDVRDNYCRLMEEINENRKQILGNYFNSIGITASSGEQWSNLKESIDPIENFKCFDMALK